MSLFARRSESQPALAVGLLQAALLDVKSNALAVHGGGVAGEHLAAIVTLPAHCILRSAVVWRQQVRT